jgi:hypothetical protein
MASRIEIETRPVFEKDVQKAFGGNELLKEITYNFSDGRVRRPLQVNAIPNSFSSP